MSNKLKMAVVYVDTVITDKRSFWRYRARFLEKS